MHPKIFVINSDTGLFDPMIDHNCPPKNNRLRTNIILLLLTVLTGLSLAITPTSFSATATIELDTDGPTVTRLQTTPTDPINNEAQPEITITLGLDEPIKPGEQPTLSYQLSGPGRTITSIVAPTKTQPQTGEKEAWQAVFSLPADAGLQAAETLSFLYSGRDNLDNISTRIEASNQFQVYQGDLPPLDTPVGLTARALPDGKVALSWKEVAEAADYTVFRKAESEQTMQPIGRSDNLTEFEDQPGEDGLYFYAVASVREVEGEEALSGLSAQVSVRTDSSTPNPPQNLVLNLIAQGIQLTWQAPAGGEAVTYALYRSADTEITSLEGLEPLVRGIDQTMVIDPTPSVTEHCYVIAAEDSIGNSSPPSNSAYANFNLLPVNGFTINQQEIDPPVLSWTHPNHGSLSGYNLYLQQDNSSVKINRELLSGQSYTDTGYTGEERDYILKAVDEHGIESIGRSLSLPKLRAELLPGSRLERGVMNRLGYRVKNLGTKDISNIKLQVQLDNKIHLSEKFDLEAGDYQRVDVVIGGYEELPDIADAQVRIVLTPNPGEKVTLIREDQVDVFDGMLSLRLGNEEFVRGVTGTVWFSLENTGAETIEIITAADSGNRDSGSIRYLLTDSDDNVLVTSGFRQSGGSDLVTLSNGHVVTRIPPGGAFTSEPSVIQIPSGTPDELTVRLFIDDIYYRHTKEDEVRMNGLTGDFDLTLTDTSYYGTITEITPQISEGDQDIVITGQAIDRDTEQPLADAVLNLVITLNGFERSYEVISDQNGSFSHTFIPLSGESGRYQVRLVHPDLLDKPIHGEFTITRVTVTPSAVNLSIPRNYEQDFAPQVKTGAGTELTGLRLLYEAEDQPGGELPPGLHVTSGNGHETVPENTTVTLPLTLWADNNAADSGQFILRVVSDESGPEGWGRITVNTALSTAKPVLSFSPMRLEAGVVQGETVTETVTLNNIGLAALEGVQLSLTDLDGSPAPDWLKINIPSDMGDIEVGEKRNVPVTFAPATIPAGAYQFKLLVKSYNYPDTAIYLFVIVNEDGLGNGLFKVADIYTGTLNAQGDFIQGLAGAKITLQNEATLISEPVRTTDEFGEVLYEDLPAGRYKYRITANNHQEQIGRILIRPGMTANEEIFLDYNLVTVTWEVTEITIEDRYEIILTAIYETDVPAPVVVLEPASLPLPLLSDGMIYNGEFTLTNYGLVRAENLEFNIPPSDEHYRFELLEGVPDSLGAKETITIPYRITCLNSLEQDDGSGGGCYTYNRCLGLTYGYPCANGSYSRGSNSFCWNTVYGSCGSTGGSTGSGGGGGGGGGGGIWSVGGGGSSGGGTTSTPVPTPKPISGAKCLPKPNNDCNECSLKAGREIPVGSTVDILMREYKRDHEDLSVQALGGPVSVHRYYRHDTWLWEFNHDNLIFEYDGRGELTAVQRHSGTYENTYSNPNLFRHRSNLIEKTAEGFRWSDKNDNWKTYDSQGRLLAYGKRTLTHAKAIYENDRFTGWADADGNQLLWYEYSGDQLTAVSDASGRRVEYGWSGDDLSSVTDLLGNTTSFSYSNGRLSRVAEPGGKVRNITYDSYGNLRSVKDDQGNGHTFEFDYDKGRREYYAAVHSSDNKLLERWFNYDGFLVKEEVNGVAKADIVRDGRTLWETDERGFVTEKVMDEWDNTIRILYPDESWLERTYSQPGNLLVRTDRMDIITAHEYDDNGNRTATVEAQGTEQERRTEFTWSATGKLLSVTRTGGSDGTDAVTRYGYDDLDNLVSITDPEGNTVKFLSHDPSGRPRTVEDGRGYQWHLTYDAEGNLRFIHDHNHELISELRYDAAGNRTSAINALLKEFRFRYDAEGRLLETEDPYAGIRAMEYDPFGRLISSQDEEQNITRREYDSFGRLSKTVDGVGQEISYEYSAQSGCSSCGGAGDLISGIIFPTFSRHLEYDSRGRVISQKDVLSTTEERTTLMSYDGFGNLETLTDPLGRVTRYTYDELNRKVSETNELGEVIRYSYDSRDNLVELIDPNNGSTYFEYDLTGRLLKETKPLQQETSYSYDANSNLISTVDATGRKVVYSYDLHNRLEKTEFFSSTAATAPAKTVTYTYNKAGSLTGYDDTVTSASYQYDDLQRRISETVNYPGFSLSHGYSYYGNSLKKSYTDPAGRTRSWTYDKAGRPTGLNLGATGEVTTNSYTWNQPEKITLPGGSTRNFIYNQVQELTGVTTKDPGSNPVIDYTYTRASNGRVDAKKTEHGDYTYGYDAADRLTAAKSPRGDEAYTYDGLGNRKTSSEYGDWSYDVNNRLTSYGDTTLGYDDHGNLISKTTGASVTAFSYTADNRLQQVQKNNSTVASYGYDPFGRRLWKEVGGTRTYFHYNDEGLAGEYDASGNELRTYGYNAGSPWSTDPLFVQENDQYYWYQNDHLGTPQKIIAQNGVTVWSAKYDAFGKASVEVATITNNLRFAGQYFDEETGLHYNWNRYYDPATGRYITADPIGLEGGINHYAYVYGNPSNLIDPTGEYAWAGAAVGAVIGGVSGYYASGGTWQGAAGGALIGGAAGFFGQFGKSAAGGALIGALVGLGENLAFQTIVEGKDIECIDYWELGGAGLLGAVTGGFGGRFAGGAGAAKSVDPKAIRFSQRSVNNADEIAGSMSAKGWNGDAIDVVRMPDGKLTTLDNTRVLAADRAGINAQARIHNYDDALPSNFVDRFTTKKGGVPSTFGDAVTNRIGTQGAAFRNTYPSGSYITGVR
jgi:RHS repeat-associated protein